MQEEVIVTKHAEHCVIHEDGPCTCGVEEVEEELLFEAAGLTNEDFEGEGYRL